MLDCTTISKAFAVPWKERNTKFFSLNLFNQKMCVVWNRTEKQRNGHLVWCSRYQHLTVATILDLWGNPIRRWCSIFSSILHVDIQFSDVLQDNSETFPESIFDLLSNSCRYYGNDNRDTKIALAIYWCMNMHYSIKNERRKNQTKDINWLTE